MLSFKPINSENKDALIKELSAILSDGDSEEISEIVCGVFSGCGEDSEAAVTASRGALLFRIFDMGRYAFLFPFEISADADIRGAISDISEYAVREEVPLIFSDVPAECLGMFSGYRHMDIDAEDAEGESYRVRINTECELLSDFPELEYGRVKLNALCEDDIPCFSRLSRDGALNKFWGYDYRDDNPEAIDSYFYEAAVSEFERGVSMSFAVRYEGRFAGEVCFFGFDGKGGAEYAVRILPEYHGIGLGGEASSAAFEMAKSIGLTKVYAEILEENKPSIKMVEKMMDFVEACDGKRKYVLEF